MRAALLAWFGVTLVVGAAPHTAWADLVYLSGGRTLSVKAHRQDGNRVILTLRGGGEIVCDAALVERVAADEVPYPDPPVEPVGETPSTAAAAPGDTRYAGLIVPLAARYGVDPALVRAVVEVESNFEPSARSRKGAMGLMQLMPATARQYAVRDPYDPKANLDAGIRHLRSLLDRYDLRLALAAYNAGEATVLRYGGVPPFQETRSYVTRVLRKVSPDVAAR